MRINQQQHLRNQIWYGGLQPSRYTTFWFGLIGKSPRDDGTFRIAMYKPSNLDTTERFEIFNIAYWFYRAEFDGLMTLFLIHRFDFSFAYYKKKNV